MSDILVTPATDPNQPVLLTAHGKLAIALRALREVEAHHVEQNRLKGRPESLSKTLRLCRDALNVIARGFITLDPGGVYIIAGPGHPTIKVTQAELDGMEGLDAVINGLLKWPTKRTPTRIFRNPEGIRCSTCDGTDAHVHGYDDQGEVPGRSDGSDFGVTP